MATKKKTPRATTTKTPPKRRTAKRATAKKAASKSSRSKKQDASGSASQEKARSPKRPAQSKAPARRSAGERRSPPKATRASAKSEPERAAPKGRPDGSASRTKKATPSSAPKAPPRARRRSATGGSDQPPKRPGRVESGRNETEVPGATRERADGATAREEPTSPPSDVGIEEPPKPEATPEADAIDAARSRATEKAPEPAEQATPEQGNAGDEEARAMGEEAAPESTEQPMTETTATHADDAAVDEEVARQIRELEARLGGMIRDSETDVDEEPPQSLREQVSFAAREVVDRLAAPVERPGHDDGGVVDAVRGLLSSDYYLRQWGRLGMRNRSEEVDDFGLDTVYEQRLLPLWDFLYNRYFRVETIGVENVPSDGRCLIVANHSGTLPLDGVMLRACMRIEHPAARELRWLSEDFIYHLPFVGAFMSRIGAVRACQENAERLLSKEALVAVFPEGVKGIGKLYKDRYRLQRFGRGGFIRLCLRSRTPLVPCAVIGAEEASPMLYRDEFFSRALGLPYLPVTPTFPWLGPAGLIPAPTKWRIVFGEPLEVDQYDPSAAEDHVLVGRLAERVRTTIQHMLDVGVGQRRSVWSG